MATTPPKKGPGGHRPGAGRPPDPATFAEVSIGAAPVATREQRAEEMAQLLHAIAVDAAVDMKHRVAAAKALIGRAQPTAGKKEQQKDDAAATSGGRFGLRAVS